MNDVKKAETNHAPICIVAAIGPNGEIGQENDLPWRGQVPGELAWFKEVTTGYAKSTIIYGRKTFESLGNKPLPGRRNIVISSTLPFVEGGQGYEVQRDLQTAATAGLEGGEKVFIIGGSGIFKEACTFAEEMWLSHIPGSFPKADTFFPFINPRAWIEMDVRRFASFTAVKYVRRKGM